MVLEGELRGFCKGSHVVPLPEPPTPPSRGIGTSAVWELEGTVLSTFVRFCGLERRFLFSDFGLRTPA
jgi:hypothetical protein